MTTNLYLYILVYMAKKKMLLELQEELRDYYTKVISEINPGLGFNPFLRAVLFFFSDVDQHLLRKIILWGIKKETAFEEGSYKLRPGLIVHEAGYSKTEQDLFDYMAQYVNQPYVPEEDIDYSDGYELFMEQREQLKNELRDEILDELRKPQGKDNADTSDDQ